MEDIKIRELWQSMDTRLLQTEQLNYQVMEDITHLKIRSSLASMKPLKYFTLLAGIIWVGIGSVIVVNLFLHAYADVSKIFLYSASIQILLIAAAVWIYLYQLILLNQVDITEPIIFTQERITRLKTSTLLVTRILFLQTPLWPAFSLTEATLRNGHPLLLILQAGITLLALWLALWLFFNIKYTNRNKRWFRWIFAGREWDPLMRSMEMLGEIKEYKKDS